MSSSSSGQKKNFKQGNLFSFFSKKSPANNNNNKSNNNSKTSSGSQPSSSQSKNPGGSKSSNNTSSHNQRGSTTSARSSPRPKPLKSSLALIDKIKVGRTRIKVFWQEDRQYYACDILNHRSGSTSYCLKYDDGETEWTDLATQTFKILYDDDEEEGNDNSINRRNTKRRRHINDDSDEDDDDDDEEEENEWKDDSDGEDEDDDDDSFSADYDDEEDDDADDQWMDTDDDDDDDALSVEEKKRPKKKKKITKVGVKVTHHDGNADVEMTPTSSRGSQKTSSASASFPSTSRPSSSAKAASGNGGGPRTTTPLQQFTYASSSAKTVTSEKDTDRSSTPASVSASSMMMTSTEKVSNGGQLSGRNSVSMSTTKDKPPPFTKGEVNVRGSHVHNHLGFLRNPRDKEGRRPGDTNYDPRTLKVNKSEWEHVSGGKMTAAVEQWWDLKSRYFDTVLLFKTGKFYEMFHQDSDVGVEVLGLTYMKGHVAHAGFPEAAYGKFADKLVRHGYKVARVEQTETPEQLKIRKQKSKGKGSKTPKAVNREVCSIMTLGTRTFCALDDVENFLTSNGEDEKGTTSDGSGGCGPLLAISELVFDTDNVNDDDNDGSSRDDNARPTCEYGITMIDAIRGVVTLGQFADDVLRSRMYTLLTSFTPCEILIKAEEGTSKELRSMIQAYQNNSRAPCRIEMIGMRESFPASTALDPEHRRFLERTSASIRPWDTKETLDELHRKKYFPRGSRRVENNKSIARWPAVLQAVVEGGANLCLSSFGATLFYLQRNLIDQEILSMGIIKAYIPRTSTAIEQESQDRSQGRSSTAWYAQQESQDRHEDDAQTMEADGNPLYNIPQVSQAEAQNDGMEFNPEDSITYMQMDGTTLHNLEILANSIDFKQNGSLWSKINYTKSPHGARMLRAWLLRPLFRKADIERRVDAVTSLASGAGSLALKGARHQVMGMLGDLDRLLSRIHSVGCGVSLSQKEDDGEDTSGYYPNDRAVLYEGPTYTKRKVQDFSKALNGLNRATQIPEIFSNVDVEPGSLLYKLVRLVQDGGLFPDMSESLDWYFKHFDCKEAASGNYEPVRGSDPLYDEACDTVARVQEALEQYKNDMIQELSPRHVVRSQWKYINIKSDSKDKYLIELPASIVVPHDFKVTGKRGSGAKQINKYRTSFVAGLVNELEQAIDVQQAGKAKGMQRIFAKFDSQRSLWTAAAHATAILDALGSLALVASHPGFCRPAILDCPPDQRPSINIVQGRHPCIADSSTMSEFVANDLALGGSPSSSAEGDADTARLLLLSGPNMGGKSTLLRQTCLIAILAQIGSYVPAESCSLTPIDCIFTRLGASDRILLGQSTFFVELAETAAALRGATRRSLVIMDELGRGTSTFDGTAIASATVKHLVERSQCLSLFATHYHSLLDEFEDSRDVRLGHMQCIVNEDDDDQDSSGKGSVIFLYTLGPGQCPKSFGINVAKLAGLPSAAVANAKVFSENFEKEMTARGGRLSPVDIDSNGATVLINDVMKSIEDGDENSMTALWEKLQKK